MKRWIFAIVLTTCAAAFVAAPARAAEEAAGKEHESNVPQSTSPLYSPSEGLVTGVCSLLIFGVLVAVLGKYAWAPILTGLKSREEKIRKEIADAEAARAKADALLKDYNTQLADASQRVADMLNKAKSDAEALAAQIRVRGQAEAEEVRERATREIEDAKNQAIRDIQEQAAVLATNVAEKIIRRSLNPDDYRDLVSQSIGQLQGMRA